MIINQEHFPTYKPLFPVLRTQTASLLANIFGIESYELKKEIIMMAFKR
jgi:hypothetical protein